MAVTNFLGSAEEQNVFVRRLKSRVDQVSGNINILFSLRYPVSASGKFSYVCSLLMKSKESSLCTLQNGTSNLLVDHNIVDDVTIHYFATNLIKRTLLSYHMNKDIRWKLTLMTVHRPTTLRGYRSRCATSNARRKWVKYMQYFWDKSRLSCDRHLRISSFRRLSNVLAVVFKHSI